MPSTDPLKVLAVDDNQDNLTTLKAVLREALPDCGLLTALSGPEAIEIARAKDPDVILLDIQMPGMDGHAVCRELKDDESLRAIPVVFMTAVRTDRDNRVRALEAGGEGFISKPIDEHELVAQIRAMARIKAANRRQRLEAEQLAALVKERTAELEASTASFLQSEARFRRAVFDSPFPILLHAEDGEIILASSSWCDITGYTREELRTIGDWTERAYGERKLQVQADIDRLYGLTHRVSEGDYAIRTRNGDTRIWDFSSAPLGRLPDGRRLVISMAMDVTGRRMLEQQLSQTTELLERTAEMARFGSWELDVATTAVTYSKETARIHEVAFPGVAEKLSQGDRYYGPEAWPAVRAAVQAAIDHGTPYDLDTPFITAKGRHLWVRVQGFPVMQDGKVVKLRGSIQDITERKQAEEALREKSEALRASNAELELFNRAMIGRELRMIELKQEVNELCRRLGEPPRHVTDPLPTDRVPGDGPKPTPPGGGGA